MLSCNDITEIEIEMKCLIEPSNLSFASSSSLRRLLTDKRDRRKNKEMVLSRAEGIKGLEEIVGILMI